MIKTQHAILTCLGAALIAGAIGSSVSAQAADAQPKPRLYTYEAEWTVPRAKWAEFEKDDPAEQKVLEKSLANGTLVGYGTDITILHSEDGSTHDNWWSALSIAGTLNVLDALEKAGASGATSPVSLATKHHDGLYVSEHYHWHAGTWKGAYTHASLYTVKADAPDNAVDLLAESVVVPLYEKLLADGTIIEYEVDTQAVHSGDPNLFAVVYITPTAEGIDKVNAAVRAAIKAEPLGGQAFGSTIDWTKHRDYLTRSNVTYK